MSILYAVYVGMIIGINQCTHKASLQFRNDFTLLLENVTLTRASLTAETAGNIEDRVKVWKKPMAAGLALLSRSPAGQTSAIWGDESENSLRISLLASF